MKIPSLAKLPKHKKFHIEPRYYDSVKEDVEQRVSRIKAELNIPDGIRAPSTISGSFARKRAYSYQSSVLQFVIFLILCLTITGYLYFGNNVAYAFLILMPVYIYFRFRKKTGGEQ